MACTSGTSRVDTLLHTPNTSSPPMSPLYEKVRLFQLLCLSFILVGVPRNVPFLTHTLGDSMAIPPAPSSNPSLIGGSLAHRLIAREMTANFPNRCALTWGSRGRMVRKIRVSLVSPISIVPMRIATHYPLLLSATSWRWPAGLFSAVAGAQRSCSTCRPRRVEACPEQVPLRSPVLFVFAGF